MRRAFRVVLAGAVAVVLAACGSSSGSSGPSAADTSALGARSPASGQPVKIGFISDGRTPAFDNTVEITSAEAVAKYLNDYRRGIGGRPIEIVSCQSQADPAKAADCATQLIQEKVALTVFGTTTSTPYIWKPLHDAHIPVFAFASGDTDLTADRDSTFTLGNVQAISSDLPIGLAKEKNLKKVSVVALDLPVVTSFYRTTGPEIFGKAGVQLNVVPVPLGQADMTPEMSRIAAGGPTEVHIIGNDSFCIAALRGLRSAGFTGPISMVDACLTDSTRKAVGSGLDGVIVSANVAIADHNDPGIRQWQAIIETYAKGKISPDSSTGATIYMTMSALREAVDGISGDITSTSITRTIHSMKEKKLSAAAGLGFRCNGKAAAGWPAVCTRGALVAVLDGKGQPTRYRLAGTSPIED
jgi:branched-chain amino acid transport system substrate-binding protein